MLSEKKKRSDLGLHIFLPKSKCSLKKKKGLHFNFISNFPIFLPKSRCSPKKKEGLHFDFISDFPIFLPKSRRSLKKKKRSSLRTVLWANICSESKTVYAVFEGGPLKSRGPPQKRGGLRRLPHSPHPISTTVFNLFWWSNLGTVMGGWIRCGRDRSTCKKTN